MRKLNLVYHLLNEWQLIWRSLSSSLISKSSPHLLLHTGTWRKSKKCYFCFQTVLSLCVSRMKSVFFKSRRKTWFGSICSWTVFFLLQISLTKQNKIPQSYRGKLIGFPALQQASEEPPVTVLSQLRLTDVYTHTHKNCSETGLKVRIKLSLVRGKLYGWRSAPELVCPLKFAWEACSSSAVWVCTLELW